MCMAIPMKLVEKNGVDGVCDLNGVRRNVRLDFAEDAKPGDYLLVHAGFAIEVVDEAEAMQTLELFAEMMDERELKDAT